MFVRLVEDCIYTYDPGRMRLLRLHRGVADSDTVRFQGFLSADSEMFCPNPDHKVSKKRKDHI